MNLRSLLKNVLVVALISSCAGIGNQWEWNKPQTDEVRFTEASEINIQLIRALHNRQFD